MSLNVTRARHGGVASLLVVVASACAATAAESGKQLEIRTDRPVFGDPLDLDGRKVAEAAIDSMVAGRQLGPSAWASVSLVESGGLPTEGERRTARRIAVGLRQYALAARTIVASSSVRPGDQHSGWRAGRHMYVWRLLLSLALDSSSEACLESTLGVVRISQDFCHGTGIMECYAHSVAVRAALSVAEECGRDIVPQNLEALRLYAASLREGSIPEGRTLRSEVRSRRQLVREIRDRSDSRWSIDAWLRRSGYEELEALVATAADCSNKWTSTNETCLDRVAVHREPRMEYLPALQCTRFLDFRDGLALARGHQAGLMEIEGLLE